MKTSTGRNTDFCVLETDKNKKDAHRHDSKFDGPMTSPSSIWSPFLKKTCFVRNADFTDDYQKC